MADLKSSEILSFVDGLLTVKMTGYGEQNKWGVLAFDEEQIELKSHDEKNGNYAEIEIMPSELREIRDFLNRVIPKESHPSAPEPVNPIIAAVLLAAKQQRDPIPDSDLDDEQPISLNVRLTLGDIRRAERAIRAA